MIKKMSEPDSRGRILYLKTDCVDNPAYCLTCGKDRGMGCACYNLLKEQSQYIFTSRPITVTALGAVEGKIK